MILTNEIAAFFSAFQAGNNNSQTWAGKRKCICSGWKNTISGCFDWRKMAGVGSLSEGGFNCYLAILRAILY